MFAPRLIASGRTGWLEILEHDDDPDGVSFKCLDPDGHRISGVLGAIT